VLPKAHIVNDGKHNAITTTITQHGGDVGQKRFIYAPPGINKNNRSSTFRTKIARCVSKKAFLWFFLDDGSSIFVASFKT
jgi:hypothetical protein